MLIIMCTALGKVKTGYQVQIGHELHIVHQWQG